MTKYDVTSLLQHWLEGADYDWEVAQALFKSKKYPYSLFLCHLSLEKILKALITKKTKDHPPYTHNLSYLAGKLEVKFSKEQLQLLSEMNEFNMEARYPDEKKSFYEKANGNFTKKYIKESKILREWLKKQL